MSSPQASAPRPSPPRREREIARPLFAALSELDHQPMRLRDWLTLLPAVLVSLLLNGVFIALLIFFNAGSLHADAKLKSLREDDSTQLEEKKKDDEASTIDINTPEFNAPKDITQSEKLTMPALESV